MPIRPDDFDASASPAIAERQRREQRVVSGGEKPVSERDVGMKTEEIAKLPGPDTSRRYWQVATLISLIALVSLLGAYSVTRQTLTSALSDRDAARHQAEAARLQLDQLRKEIEPAVTISKVWTQHPVYRGALTGMTIHLKFVANNLRCESIQAIVPFYLENGEAVQSSAPGFSTSTGTLAVWNDFSPQSQQANWEDAEMFLPYTAFKSLSTGQFKLKYRVLIRRKGGDWKTFAQSDWELLILTK